MPTLLDLAAGKSSPFVTDTYPLDGESLRAVVESGGDGGTLGTHGGTLDTTGGTLGTTGGATPARTAVSTPSASLLSNEERGSNATTTTTAATTTSSTTPPRKKDYALSTYPRCPESLSPPGVYKDACIHIIERTEFGYMGYYYYTLHTTHYTTLHTMHYARSTHMCSL
jgi:hypothetical protein